MIEPVVIMCEQQGGFMMKFSTLKAIAHNIADSLASGVGLPIGYFHTDVFQEASQCADGFITIDFLSGEVIGSYKSVELEKAALLYRDAFKNLCLKHGVSSEVFREAKASYTKNSHEPAFTVTIKDDRGRHSIDHYQGSPGRRIKVLDDSGRVRRG